MARWLILVQPDDDALNAADRQVVEAYRRQPQGPVVSHALLGAGTAVAARGVAEKLRYCHPRTVVICAVVGPALAITLALSQSERLSDDARVMRQPLDRAGMVVTAETEHATAMSASGERSPKASAVSAAFSRRREFPALRRCCAGRGSAGSAAFSRRREFSARRMSTTAVDGVKLPRKSMGVSRQDCGPRLRSRLGAGCSP